MDAITRHHYETLANEQGVQNDDGTTSTVRTIVRGVDGKERIFPTVWDGKILDDDQAQKRAVEAGLDKWPAFNTVDEAMAFDKQIHKDMKPISAADAKMRLDMATKKEEEEKRGIAGKIGQVAGKMAYGAKEVAKQRAAGVAGVAADIGGRMAAGAKEGYSELQDVPPEGQEPPEPPPAPEQKAPVKVDLPANVEKAYTDVMDIPPTDGYQPVQRTPQKDAGTPVQAPAAGAGNQKEDPRTKSTPERAAEFADANRGRTDLNAKNMADVPGTKVQYAGQYGDTDVYGNLERIGTRIDEKTGKMTPVMHGRFSDLDNIATLTGGQPAPLPDNDNPVVSNATANTLENINSVTPNELVNARKAAMERGDYDAVERSYMTSEERKAADRKSELEDLRSSAYAADPVKAYSIEQESELARMNAADEYERQLQKAYAGREKQLESTRNEMMKFLMDRYGPSEGDFGEEVPGTPPQELLGVLNRVMAVTGATDRATLMGELVKAIEAPQAAPPQTEEERAMVGLNAMAQ